MADEIHGVSIIESVKDIIDMRNEAMADYRKLLHRNVYPVRLWTMDSEDNTEIASFKRTVAKAKYEGEDIFIPKGNVETQTAGVGIGDSLNPLPWINMLNRAFIEIVGVPAILVAGSSALTQTAAQVEYLGWEQTIEEEQLYMEEQILLQLNLEIELKFPASLQSNLLSDQRKDGDMNQQFNQPSNMTPSFEQGGKISGY